MLTLRHRSTGFPLVSGTPQQFNNVMGLFRGRKRKGGKRFRGRPRPMKRTRFAGKFNTTTARKGIKSGIGVTGQYDRTGVYQRKSMPRGKKRRWKSFVRRVHAVAEKDLGSKTAVFNDLVSFTTTAGNQLIGECCLYGNDALSGTLPVTHLRDISRIAGTDPIGDTGKMFFQSGVLDITIQNISVVGVSPLAVSMELDIYEIIAGKSFDDNVGVQGGTASREQGTLKSVIEEAELKTGTISGAGNSLALGNRGVTPFDIPQAISQYRLKILKKTKYRLTTNQTITYQIRDPRRHVFGKLDVDPSQVSGRPKGVNLRGATRWLLFIGKGNPANAEDPTLLPGITVGITRKYMYKIDESTLDKDQYNP